ncbi:MAG: Hsp20/alpha crystallin family protein [Pyrinomonadaceae bacterium]|nr:Hsp20/alpha crystallin family protein [Pyrinomonadaceae bacterium]
MNIVRYDPFRELRGLQDEVNRLFMTSFGRGDNEQMSHGSWLPSVDISETQNEIVIEAELAGLKPEDVEISIENNTLTLRGERKLEKKEQSDNYHRVERSYGSFTRSFTLPRTVSGDEANAEFNHGVLKIALPKREETKARKIEIKGGDASTARTIETGTNDKAKAANS